MIKTNLWQSAFHKEIDNLMLTSYERHDFRIFK